MRDVVPSFCSTRCTTPTFFEIPPLITKSSFVLFHAHRAEEPVFAVPQGGHLTEIGLA